ncbi:TlpA disulfide reductase family protein [Williamwhitmania taraxaci]|uniref:Peroxiredoxin n=1 Tax=Williamwhitmania taraxaci TaxID=1640674 RepID=A0A1G6QJB9_9BACT|nr:TlpA disulfide reductase family protein [Williamwhitmania taraxaci]SDC92479.1 Peroxiredoxin [Williamwhitmania taraxaci]
MKRLLLGLIPILALASCSQGNKFDLNVTVTGQPTGNMVYLQTLNEREFINVDSTEIKDNAFTFTGQLEQPDLYFIRIGQSEPIMLFLENSSIEVKANLDSIDKAVIKGSATQDLYKSYNTGLLPIQAKMDNLYAKADSLKMVNALTPSADKQLEIEYDAISSEQSAYTNKFIQDNPKSVASAFIAYRFLANRLEFPELEKLVLLFDASIAKSQYVVKLTEKVETMRKTAVGQPYVDFSLADTSGTQISLSSLVDGKTVVMIDFWASWCGPCRGENPSVVAMYAELKGKGFQIMGVSLDKTKEAWIKGIKEDGITYPQVSDLLYWQSAAAKLYAVSGIPHTVLIGKDGKIAAKNLRGDELKAKVLELLK